MKKPVIICFAAILWCSYSRSLWFFSLLTGHLYAYPGKVMAFWNHDPEAGPPLEKHFLPKPLHMQSLLVSKSRLIQESFGCAFYIF